MRLEEGQEKTKVHDNRENDLIMVSPAVLDNRLRDFEENHKYRNTLGGDIVLAVTFILPVLTATFNNISKVQGATIRGIFVAGFVFMLIKISLSIYRITRMDGFARVDLISSLLSNHSISEHKSKDKKINANQKTK